ncbi:CHAD domain-containing protein [Kutzneria sp. CA-103260]|uniref:CHAD domain-containing protein n=1 Tax=Kutzneria sp. CA-103260 TaxID=2802641 RepID=UPI001BAE3F8E|nr:CHAD domain-containing protein [Kutzneria sp. CA-103260]QUQ69089.1 CHAD domain-containing protein [Kutzneria sp. CA-103260]
MSPPTIAAARRPVTPERLGLAPRPVTATAKDPVARHVRAALHAQALAMLHYEPGTRTGEDPEDLHQMRVAVRRLRAVLKSAPGSVPDCERLRAELGWLGGALGPVRDLDVLIDRLRAESEDFPDDERAVAATLLDGLVAERLSARERLTSALNSPRYRTLLGHLAQAANSEVDPDAPQPELLDLVRAPYRKLRRSVQALPADPPDEQLHRLRILGKRLRYAAELVRPIAGKQLRDLVRATKELQEVLGEHQDACVAEQEVRRLVAAQGDVVDWDLVFVAGRLVEREHVRRVTTRDQWHEAWLAVSRDAEAALR